jgi:Tfp pilus assembly protein PilN
MSDRNKQFMNLYQKYRYEHQRNFYDARIKEFKSAHRQIILLTGLIMFLTAVTATLTAVIEAPDWKPVLAVLAIVFPALSTALAAYNELFAFERQSKLYGDAERALHRALADAPDMKQGIGESEYDSAVGAYVNEIEDIFRKEQGQWGQLASEIKTIQQVTEKSQTPTEKTSGEKESK